MKGLPYWLRIRGKAITSLMLGLSVNSMQSLKCTSRIGQQQVEPIIFSTTKYLREKAQAKLVSTRSNPISPAIQKILDTDMKIIIK